MNVKYRNYYLRFWVEKENNRHPEQVEACEEEVRSALDVAKHDRIDQDRPADTDSPTSDPKAIPLCTHFRWEDFGGDEESHGPPGCCIEKVEQEKHGNSGRRDCRSLFWVMERSFEQAGRYEVDEE